MYVIKHLPEDFVVDEVSVVNPGQSGSFLYFKLWKRDSTTFDALQRIASALGVGIKQVGFAGNKDRRAVTTQVCSVRNVSRERLEQLSFSNIRLEFLGYGNAPVALGMLKGNNFRIVVRNIDNFSQDSRFTFRSVNYFDEQRFSKHNVAIGRAIIKGDFESVVLLLVEDGCYKSLSSHLSIKKKDFVNALRMVPLTILKLFVHSFQSYCWNECVSAYIKAHSAGCISVPYSCGELVFPRSAVSDADFPLLSFDAEFNSREVESLCLAVLEKQGVSFRDFIIRQVPEITPVSSQRKVFVESEISSQVLDDELYLDAKKVVLEFFLPSGSYATMLVRQLFL